MTTLITGGAGFIGTNLADRLIRDGEDVVILDALIRPGSEDNLQWLQSRFGLSAFRFIGGDVASPQTVVKAMAGVDRVFHLAAQTAVTTSLDDPWSDFETNVIGTINVLEAIRRSGREIPLVFTSTNKVYGELEGIVVKPEGSRYVTDRLNCRMLYSPAHWPSTRPPSRQETPMHVELVDPAGVMLREIADKRMKRDDVALTYAFALRQSFDPRCADEIDFALVNHRIIERWSMNALKYIKERAWGIYEGRIDVG
jgi:hypothetical protein